MGPKKQAKGGKKPEEEDNSTKEFSMQYKKSCRELEFPMYKPLEAKVNALNEDGSHLNEILVIEQFGLAGMKTITKALKATKYFKNIFS